MKTLQYILLAISIGIILFIIMLYIALRTKITDVSKLDPYQQYLNIPLKLKSEARLVRNVKAFAHQEAYLLISNPKEEVYSTITEIHTLPAGTELIFHSAKDFRNGTSGFTASMLIGSIQTPQGEKAFEARWGDQSLYLK